MEIGNHYPCSGNEIERLIRVGHFKGFVDEPYAVNREERPQQRSLEKVHEVLTIIGGSHLATKSRNAQGQYTKDTKTLPLVRVQKANKRPAKQVRRELEDIVFTKANTRWVHHPHADALVIIV